jgi:acylphosphatase
VAGWVTNRWDGAVEAVFEGDEEVVERLVAFCRKARAELRWITSR